MAVFVRGHVSKPSAVCACIDVYVFVSFGIANNVLGPVLDLLAAHALLPNQGSPELRVCVFVRVFYFILIHNTTRAFLCRSYYIIWA